MNTSALGQKVYAFFAQIAILAFWPIVDKKNLFLKNAAASRDAAYYVMLH
jgi:hypothetical protein